MRQSSEPTVGTLVRMPEGVRCFEVGEDDIGDPARHYRSVSPVQRMLRSGLITPSMGSAAEHFAQDFLSAFRDSVKTSRLEIGASGMRTSGLERLERHTGAMRRVDQALASVGGADSPGAAALWYVCGLGMSLNQWASREGWGGRLLRHDEAKGVLIAALAVLAREYGYDRS